MCGRPLSRRYDSRLGCLRLDTLLIKEAEERGTIRHEEGRLAQLLAEAGILQAIEALEVEDAGGLERGIAGHHLSQLLYDFRREQFGLFDIGCD